MLEGAGDTAGLVRDGLLDQGPVDPGGLVCNTQVQTASRQDKVGGSFVGRPRCRGSFTSCES